MHAQLIPSIIIGFIRNKATRPSENPTRILLPIEFLGTCKTVGMLSNSIIFRTRQCSSNLKTRPEHASTVMTRLVFNFFIWIWKGMNRLIFTLWEESSL